MLRDSDVRPHLHVVLLHRIKYYYTGYSIITPHLHVVLLRPRLLVHHVTEGLLGYQHIAADGVPNQGDA